MTIKEWIYLFLNVQTAIFFGLWQQDVFAGLFVFCIITLFLRWSK